MRVSTLGLHQQALSGLLNASAENSKTQAQIASGRRIQTPADDPIATTKILKLEHELSVREQYQRNIDNVESSLGLSEGLLQQSIGVLQRVRDLTIQSGSGSNTQADRGFIRAEISSRIEEMLGIMNAKNANGEYLFGGHSGSEPPFATTPEEGFAYRGDQGQRSVQVSGSTRVPVTDNGFDLFVDVKAARPDVIVEPHPENDQSGGAGVGDARVVDHEAFSEFFPQDAIIEFEPLNAIEPPGPSYTVRTRHDGRVIEDLQRVPFSPTEALSFAGMQIQVVGSPQPGDTFFVESTDKQPIINTLRRLEQGLGSITDAPEDIPALEDLIASTLSNIDLGMESILETRAEIGARLNTVDSTRDLHEEVEILSQGVLSEVRDLDFAEAVSRLSFQSFVLEAAQQSFARIQNLSLFNAI